MGAARYGFAVHHKQLAVHGGLDGLRDLNAVKLALGRAQNVDADCNRPPDAADVPAAYIHGLASSGGSNDGNQRTAWVIGCLFLTINGETLVLRKVDAINFMLAVAAGNMGQLQTAEWTRQRLAP